MNRNNIKVLVIGNITHDVLPNSVIIGGSAFYCSQVYKALGAEVSLISNIGSDFKFRKELCSMNLFLNETGRTTSFENIYDADGSRIQKSFVQCAPIRYKDIRVDLNDYDIIHLCPVLGEIDLPEWVGNARSKYFCVGMQGWLKKVTGNGNVIPKKFSLNAAKLKGIDVAFLSDEDQVGNPDVLHELKNVIPIVVETNGEQGCTIYNKTDNSLKLYSYRTNCIDPTGAGDTFSAAFMYYYSLGKPIIECGRIASAVASIIIEDFGAKSITRILEYKSRYKSINIL